MSWEIDSKEDSIVDVINGMKRGVEFLLFMSYATARREELLECHYPFVSPIAYNDEMEKLNTLRHQIHQRPPPIKHTITDTYYDIH